MKRRVVYRPGSLHSLVLFVYLGMDTVLPSWGFPRQVFDLRQLYLLDTALWPWNFAFQSLSLLSLHMPPTRDFVNPSQCPGSSGMC